MAIPMPERNSEYFRRSSGPAGAEAELLVYEALKSGLSDEWLLFTNVIIRKPRSNVEQEVDVILVHQRFGIVFGEVKSFDLTGDELSGPADQLTRGRQYFKTRLREIKIFRDIEFNQIQSFVVSPKSTYRPSATERSVSFNANQILVADDMKNLRQAIEQGICESNHYKVHLDPQKVDVLKVLLDDRVPLDESDPRLRNARAALADRRIEDQVSNLLSLEVNRRVFVTGAAGAGKTWLATEWARRASEDGKRVLLTCYNEALADLFELQMVGCDGVVVAPFLRHLEEQNGWKRRDARRGEDLSGYWLEALMNLEETGSLADGAFDLIVVDEAQDFEKEWIEGLELLLVSLDAPILMVGDLSQNVRRLDHEHFSGPGVWTRASLTKNLRSTPPIAKFCARFGGSLAAEADLLAAPVQLVPVKSQGELVAFVANRSQPAQRRSRGDKFVLTTSEEARDLLRSEIALMVPWRKRDEGLVCVTANKVKGLEVSDVILVIWGKSGDLGGVDELIYSGASRATATLTVVCAPQVAAALRASEPIDWDVLL